MMKVVVFAREVAVKRAEESLMKWMTPFDPPRGLKEIDRVLRRRERKPKASMMMRKTDLG